MRFDLLRWWWPVLAWMLIIFTGSTELGSTHHTSRIIGPFLRFFKPDVLESTIQTWQSVARKGAHMAEYAILALLLLRALERMPLFPLNPRTKQGLRNAFLIATLYAVSDELHQLFVATRQSSAWDVLRDIAGAGLALIILHQKPKQRSKPSNAGRE